MKKISKKGQVSGLQGFIMGIVSIAVLLAVGLIVLGELQGSQVTGTAACNSTDVTGCGAAYNSTGSIITKLGTVPTWIGILITVALAFTVLAFFAFRKRG